MIDLLKHFTITDAFWGRYEKLMKDVVIPYQEKVLHDEMPGAEKSHAIDNFKAAAEVLENGHVSDTFYGMVFQDSDVAKWLEAAAYALSHYPDADLEARCDAIIDLIERAQHPDGYLNTYFTVKAPDKRWTNLTEAHELYCAGHMIEAAVAYAQCTGKTKLLHIMENMANHIYKHFIEEGAAGYPGHPEIELALMRLYHHTHNNKYLELATHFINVRGVDSDYFINETKNRGWYVWQPNCPDKAYHQAHLPVREQTKAVGHAVRAVYLYTGMADTAKVTKDESLISACKTLWHNITSSRMYVTGAIGSAYEGEAFTKDYHLPNDTTYGETCAAIGLIFFARQMLDIEKNSQYADTMERALYNCVLAGMALDGQKFFYVNPLEVIPGISGEAITHRHALPERPNWFTCACCPPNMARLLSSLANYAWSIEDETVYVHLFIGGTLDLTPLSTSSQGQIKVTTNYPYEETVTYRFKPLHQSMPLTLAIRLPFWSSQTTLLLNGEEANYTLKDGYAYLTYDFTEADILTVTFDLTPKRIFTHHHVSHDNGKIAFSRGPLIYCLEGKDNDEDLLKLYVKKDAPITATTCFSPTQSSVVKLQVDGYCLRATDSLYTFTRPQMTPYQLTLVPYYTWGNRGLNQMRVWLPEIH